MNTCPCCKRALPRITAKSPADKKLAQDVARAESAIESLRKFIHGGYMLQCADEHKNYAQSAMLMQEAAEDEITRLEYAITAPAILWRIYRRADKGESYVRVVTEAIEVAA